jgi:NTP pyrophosphatase (non-canonical NTP hydrolase)
MIDLTFHEVTEANRRRCNRWHHGFPENPDGWTGADWSNAMQGEAGEAGNVVKKLRRLDLGLWGNRKPGDDDRLALLAKLGDEIADTYLYLDLLATYYGIEIEGVIIAKFNSISRAAGFPERLPAAEFCICTPAFAGDRPSVDCPVHGEAAR